MNLIKVRLRDGLSWEKLPNFGHFPGGGWDGGSGPCLFQTLAIGTSTEASLKKRGVPMERNLKLL